MCWIISLDFSSISCPLVLSLLLKGYSTLKTDSFEGKILLVFTPGTELSPLPYSLYHCIVKDTRWVQRKPYHMDEEKEKAREWELSRCTCYSVSFFFLFLHFQWKQFHPRNSTHEKQSSLKIHSENSLENTESILKIKNLCHLWSVQW